MLSFPEEKPESWEQLLEMRLQAEEDRLEQESVLHKVKEFIAASPVPGPNKKSSSVGSWFSFGSKEDKKLSTNGNSSTTAAPRTEDAQPGRFGRFVQAFGALLVPPEHTEDHENVADLEAPPPAAPQLASEGSQAKGQTSYLATDDGLRNGVRNRKKLMKSMGAG